MSMTATIIRIGNSHGIRIPKPLLEQLDFPKQVTLEATEDGALLVRPVHEPREGWANAFAAMAAQGDDKLLIEADLPLSTFDGEEWEW